MLTRDDLIELCAAMNIDPELMNAPDDMLVTLFWHEAMHHLEAGQAVLRNFPDDLCVRLVTDPRLMSRMVDYMTARSMPEPVPPMTLAERLERGAQADIWYDVDTFGDEDVDGVPLADLIGDAQDAMMAAARILREHGLDRVL